MTRRLPRIALRLLLFNVLLVFLPVAGLFSLRSLERHLLDLQERGMVQQGRIVAAALGDQGDPFDAASAGELLGRLAGRSEARIRVVGPGGTVLADSARTPGASPPAAGAAPALPEAAASSRPAEPEEGLLSRKTFLYKVGAFLWRAASPLRSRLGRAVPSYPEAPPEALPKNEVQRALEGRYAAALRESPGQRSLTLYSVLPVRSHVGGEARGAVVVSQSTSRILRALWAVRLDLFRVFAVSVLVAALLSLVVAATIVRPLARLRDEAGGLLDRRGRLKRTFRGTKRKDEIGELERALEELTRRQERHLAFVESFSSDVAHEFRNPLASIRSATELLAETDDPGERKELLETVEREVARMDRLLSGVREVSRLDAGRDTEPVERVDLEALVRGLVETWPYARGIRLELAAPSGGPLAVGASAERLSQAFSNLLDNAAGFSPDGGRVSVSLERRGAEGAVLVDDEGPGIPAGNLARVFDRFFTFRPAGGPRGEPHDGLGLAIVRAIVEGYGGSVAASNREGGGARFEVRLPLLPV